MLNFLLGKSLDGDPTSDAYTAFTSDAGERRLFTVLNALRENRPVEAVKPVDGNDGVYHMVITPKLERDYYMMFSEVIFEPGKSVTISCPHGVTGLVEEVEY